MVTKYCQARFHELGKRTGSWKIVQLVLLKKPDAEPKKGIKSYRAIALTSVMWKWYASCIMLRVERETQRARAN